MALGQGLDPSPARVQEIFLAVTNMVPCQTGAKAVSISVRSGEWRRQLA
jgi:hypothetical protein